MQIAIVGCGSTGLFTAASLLATGVRPDVYCFSDSNVAEIGSKGIIIRGLGELYAKPSVAHVSLARRKYDFVVLATTLNHLFEGIDVARKMLKESGLGLVLLQPSPYAIEMVRRAQVPIASFVGLYTCIWPSHQGGIEWSGGGAARCAGLDDICRLLADAYRIQGLKVDVLDREDLERLTWDSLLVRASLEPVAAILGVGLSKLKSSSHARQLIHSIAQEVEMVATRFIGRLLRPPRDALEEMFSLQGCLFKMCRDIESRSKTEIDYLNGYVVHKAALKGIYTPYNLAVYLEVKALEEMMVG